MDALEQLGQMHDEARQVFEQITNANPDERMPGVTQSVRDELYQMIQSIAIEASPAG